MISNQGGNKPKYESGGNEDLPYFENQDYNQTSERNFPNQGK